MPRDGLKQRDMLVVWAAGGEVVTAEGAQMLVGNAFEPLQAGGKVKIGDLISLPPGSKFELRTPEGARLRTPPTSLRRAIKWQA